MPTEDSQTTTPSRPAALMRAAQAIVDRRRQLAAASHTAPGSDPQLPGINAAPTARAPDPGALSFQGTDAKPGQLLGSINTLTAPAPDGSGFEVRHADSGRLIAQGGSADEAEGRAQDLAGWLGRRRLVGWLHADTPSAQAVSLDDNTTSSSSVLGSGAGLKVGGKTALIKNPELIKRWESTESAWTGKSGFSPQFAEFLKSHGIQVDPRVIAANLKPAGSLTQASGVPLAKANNTNGKLAEKAIADRYRSAGYKNVKMRVHNKARTRVVDVVVGLPASDPRNNQRLEIESKVGRVTSRAEYVEQAVNDAQALAENRAARTLGRVSESLGRVAIPVGIVLDAKELHDAYQADGRTIGQHTERAASGIAGGAVGGWAGALGGAAAGAALGSVVPVVGTAVGGVVGGLLGGLGGGFGGTAAGHDLYDYLARE